MATLSAHLDGVCLPCFWQGAPSGTVTLITPVDEGVSLAAALGGLLDDAYGSSIADPIWQAGFKPRDLDTAIRNALGMWHCDEAQPHPAWSDVAEFDPEDDADAMVFAHVVVTINDDV